MIQPVSQSASDPTPATPAPVDTGATAAAASGAARNDSIDQQQFLMLFVSQLQNQDPLNPLDANGLTEQLAQFSSLEQLFTINTNLEAVHEALTAREAVDPLRLLDTEVTVPGDTVTLADGTASGLVVDVPSGVLDLEAEIVTAGGAVLRTLSLGTPPVGELDLPFDGKDDRGATLADGSYQVRVTGRDADGESVSVPTLVRERVTGVDLSEQPPVLLLGTRRVALADVQAIRSVTETEDEG